MEGKSVVYAPKWLKFGIMLMLVATLLMGFYITYQLNHENKDSGWLLASIALVQTASSALALSMFVFFSNRDPSEQEIKEKSKKFKELIKKCIFDLGEMANTDGCGFPVIKIETVSGGKIDDFWKITMQSGEFFHVYFHINVKRLVFCFYLDSSGNKEGVDRIVEIQNSISEKNGTQFISIDKYEENIKSVVRLFQFNVDTDDYEFLFNPAKMLFVANDITAVLRWAIIESSRLGVSLK